MRLQDTLKAGLRAGETSAQHNSCVDALQHLEAKKPEIERLCRRYGVRRLRVFGSALRPDWDPETSDYDFVAEFELPPAGLNLFDQQFGLLADLEVVLGRPVDLVDWAAAKKAFFREVVESQAKDLYAA